MSESGQNLKPRWNISILVLILSAVAGLSLVSIHLPLGRDQGVSAYFGWQILQGKVPYRDLYHFNFPGIFYNYALAFKLFGLKPEAINLFDLFFRLFTLIGVYLVGARLFGSKVGIISAGIYGIFSTVVYNSYWQNAQKETFALGGLVYCLYFFSRAYHNDFLKKIWFLVAGIFGFWAMLYKPTVSLAPALMVLALLLNQSFSFKNRIIGVMSFGTGFLIPAIAVMFYFHREGALSEMVKQVFIFGISYGGQYYSGGFKIILLVLWKFLKWAIDFGFLVGFAGLGFLSLEEDKREERKLLFWFGLGLFLNILVQLKFFTYHFMVLLLPLSIFAGVFLGEQWPKFLERQTRGKKILLWVLLFFFLLANLKSDLSRYPRELLYDLKKISKEDFLEKYGKWGSGDICVIAEYKVARYLREQTRTEDKVLVFGLEPAINFLAQRASPGRFCYDLPLTYQFGSENFFRYQNQLRKEFIKELIREVTAYIVIVERDTSTIEPKDSYEQMLSWVEFRDFLTENYFLDTKIEHYYLYQRK